MVARLSHPIDPRQYPLDNELFMSPTVNHFDASIIHFVNQFSQRSWLFDRTVAELQNNLLLAGGLITSLIWWVWVRETPDRERNRSFVLAGVVLTILSLAIARALALFLPFRERPMFSSSLGLRMPISEGNAQLIHWSSFPSDHAVMYFSLATMLFFAARKIGIFAYCHALFFICFPLLYRGIHYPTDLIAGALIGTGVASLASIDRVRETIANPGLRWRASSPSTFYPTLYLCTLLTATQFDPVRNVAYGLWKVLKRHP